MLTIKDIYHLAIRNAIKVDPRGKHEIDHILNKTSEKYKKLNDQERDYFDIDTLINPYADTRILFGELNTKIKTVLAGIDMETSEILMAKELERNGEKIDMIIAHHPEGPGLQGLANVINIQESVFQHLGVPINVIQKLLASRISEIDRALHADNFLRIPQSAQLMNMPFGCFHTVCDNLVYNFLEKKICNNIYRTLNDIVQALQKIPEYHESSRLGNKPEIILGNKDSNPGKIAATGITGGTSGSEEIYAKIESQGVGTILTMHMSEKHRKQAEKHHINVIVCGHMASDSIGMNLFLDELEKKKIKIIPCSGLIRHSRNK